MGGHVHAVCDQRHGAEGKAGGDFHHHEDGRHACRQLGAALGLLVALAQETMVVGPQAVVVMGFDGHGGSL